MTDHHHTNAGVPGDPVTSQPLALAAGLAEILHTVRNGEGQAPAAEYPDTADVLIADLLRSGHPMPDAPEAASLPDGTPHADPRLAIRGWHARGGVYVRRPSGERELEAM